MRLLCFIAGLLAVILRAQEMLVQDLTAGEYRGIRKQNRAVPRYYLCGAAVFKKTSIINQPQKCKNICQRFFRWSGKESCSWIQKCELVPPVLGWARINGIRFDYCHFQNWQTKLTYEELGSWEWQGLQMCPENMYVYGFKSKLTERDGMAGLVLLCRSMKTVRETKQVVVFEGQGSWRYQVESSNFAVGFKARFREGYINGLSMQMAAVPYIFSIIFNYKFPENIKTSQLLIENQTITNYGSTILTKQIQLKNERYLSRIWKNSRGQHHGTNIAQMFSQLQISAKIGMPSLFNLMYDFQLQKNIFAMFEGKREEKTETFKFGTVETFKVGNRQKEIVSIPRCMICIIRKTVQTTDVDVPYSVQIGYTNGVATQQQSFNGVYQGVTVGEVVTTINYDKIC